MRWQQQQDLNPKPIIMIWLFYQLSYLQRLCYSGNIISCKIFKPLGFTSRVQQLGFTPFKDGATLAPKLADPLSPWESRLHPFYYWIKYSWSGSTHILCYINLSVRWNTLLRNQISSYQHISSLLLTVLYSNPGCCSKTVGRIISSSFFVQTQAPLAMGLGVAGFEL